MPRYFISKKQRRALHQAIDLLQIPKRKFILATLLGALGLGSAVALAATSAWLIARASQMPPILYLQVAVVCVRLFGISKALFRYVERLVSHELAVGGMGTLRANVYRRLAAEDSAKIARIRSGDMLARMGEDVDAIGDFLVKSVLPATVALVVGLGTTLGLALISPSAAFYLALGLLISGVIAPLLTMRATLTAQAKDTVARKNIANTAMYITSAAAQIKTSGQTKRVFSSLEKYEKDLNKAKDSAAYPSAWASSIDYLAMMGAVLMGAYIGIYGVANSTISEVSLSVLTLTPLAAFEATAPLGSAAMQWVRSAQAAERIMQLLQSTPAPQKIETNPENTAVSTSGDYELVVEDLSIGWPGGPVIAENINLRITPGENLAIVGPSGIGKTTLLYTLSGMIPPKSGKVLVNGKPIGKMPREEAAKYVSMTAEDAHIFETSMLENIRVARGNVSEAEALDLAQAAGLTDWLKTSRTGLNTNLGSGASTISGGERRRVLLARALATLAPFMVVDEPGEHLDTHTADTLIRDLLVCDRDKKGENQKRAVILVTHRINPLDVADKVIVIAHRTEPKGKTQQPATIVAQGTHESLLAENENYRWNLRQEQSHD